ncbi:MAG: NADH/ubiquinone/plastoquinone (complex I), partial [Candidatus Omnitrophica bacterium]|nr:NADH/ubiquinone/plastoquinone (complex I) [Candidatus Omnitrophota bacterium]
MIPADNIIPFFVIIPLAGSFIISIVGKRIKWLPDVMGFVATLSLLIISILSVLSVDKVGTLIYNVGAWKPPIGITMVMDGLTSFMVVTVNLIAFCVALFSINYMERFTSKWKFYALFLLMLGGMNGVVVTGDIFNLFVFLEIAAVASYALVAFGTEKHELE